MGGIIILSFASGVLTLLKIAAGGIGGYYIADFICRKTKLIKEDCKPLFDSLNQGILIHHILNIFFGYCIYTLLTLLGF